MCDVVMNNGIDFNLIEGYIIDYYLIDSLIDEQTRLLTHTIYLLTISDLIDY